MKYEQREGYREGPERWLAAVGCYHGRNSKGIGICPGWLVSILFAGFCLASSVPGKGQLYHVPQNSTDLVNGCARLRPDLFAAALNPAVLAAARQTRVAASAENAWSVPGLSFSRLIAVTPAGNGSLALGFQHSGNAGFQESSADFGYGLPLGKAKKGGTGSIGLLLHYRQFHADGYAPVSGAAAAVGLRLQLFPQLLTGIAFSVPFSVLRQTNHAEKLAGDYRLELGYLASEQVSFFAAWVKTDGLTAAAEIGIDYAFAGQFFFVAGLHGRTGAPFGKCGWAKNGWRIVLYTAYQAPLGFSPGLGFSWDRPDLKNENRNQKKKLP